MRTLLLLFFSAMSFFTFTQSDHKNDLSELPESMIEYYKNLNLINSFSTTPEKASLVRFLENGKSKNAPSSKREYFVLQLLEINRSNELTFASQMRNTFGSSKHIKSRVIYEISKWNKSEESIAVIVQTSQMSEPDNIKMIQYFESENPELYTDEFTMPSTVFIATEVHTWVFRNGKWYKQEVSVVLTDKS
jgi:hypothetical protein